MKEFIKVYETFWRGTLKREDLHVRILFLAMIQLCRNGGVLKESPANLADYAGMSIDLAQDALIKLQQPDPDSRTQTEDGRRVVHLGENHWKVVNYELYIKPSSDRSEYWRHHKRKSKDNVEIHKQSGLPLEETREDQKRVDTKKTTNPRLPGLKKQKQFDYPDDFEEFWKIYPRKPEKMAAYVEWQNTSDVRPPQKELLAIIADQVRQWRNQGTASEKIIYARRWLERRRWET